MAQSILEVARELIESPEAKEAYADDPDGFMAARGLDSLTADELDDAVGFVAEAMPAPVARQLVSPADPAADQFPLARVAAATVMEAGVAEAEPGSVDLTDLVDPSGQLDLPTDGIATVAPVETAAATEEEEEEVTDADASTGPDIEEDAVGITTDEDADDSGFGTGAPDVAEEEDAQEPDQLGQTETTDTDGTALEPEGESEPALAPHDDAHEPIADTHAVPGRDEEPPEDDFDDVIV